MKRQRGRNRGGGGGGGGGGGAKPTHNVNRAFDSNGPDGVKIRGHAQHVFEKYQQLARDAFGSSDRVLSENYLQHAEHYFRLLRTLQPQRPPAEILGRDTFASGYDIDFEDESGGDVMGDDAISETSQDGGEPNGSERPDGGRFEGRREERSEPRRDDQRGDSRRDDRFRDQNRDQNQNQNQNRDQRFDGRRDEPRGERPRSEGRRDEPRGEGRGRDRDDRRFERGGERASESAASTPRDPLALVEPQPVAIIPARAYGSGDVEDGSVLRSQDGGVSEAPAFLQAAAPAPEEETRRRTRRPRRPRSFEAGTEGGGDEASAPEVAES